MSIPTTGRRLSTSDNKFLHVPTQYVRDYERLLMGGVWAQLDMRFEYDEEAKGKNPFWIDKLDADPDRDLRPR